MLSPFLKLPTELRLEIYRHLFGISPTTRLFVGLAFLPRYLNEGINLHHTFEIYCIPQPNPRMTDYQTTTGDGRGERAQQQVYKRDLFLAILVTCQEVYEEAMPLFYSRRSSQYQETSIQLSAGCLGSVRNEDGISEN